MFKVLGKDKRTQARLGEIITPHGKIQTPAFVPVGTQATVKALTPDELSTLGVQLFFVNTYHMYLRPGLEVIKKIGGLHRFMGWQGPLVTDSGGFQVFSLGREKNHSGETFFGDARRSQPVTPSREPSSLNEDSPPKIANNSDEVDGRVLCASQNAHPRASLVKIMEDGVEFRSHWDGSEHFFTPEKSIEIQHALGADLIIAFDECVPYPMTHEYAKKAMERTHRWAVRSFKAHRILSLRDRSDGEAISSRRGIATSSRPSVGTPRNDRKPYQALYGVVQGSVFEDLRKESAKFISSLDFDGIAIGGVSVGESKQEMRKVLAWVAPLLPPDKPRHLLGVGEIDDIFTLVEYGIDTFDCVQPTRLARMGHVYVSNIKNQISNRHSKYQIDINKNLFEEDQTPIDSMCRCYACRHFSRAYLHHLFRVRELLAYRLATIHNIHFVQSLVADIRRSIPDGTFLELKRKWLYNS